MRRTTLSFDEVIRHEVLRQAQAPIQAVAEHLAVREASALSDNHREPQDPSITFGTGSGSLRSDEDGILIVISPAISQDHFDPYKMAVFASDDIRAAGLRSELRTWIGLASNELDISREYLINESHLFVKWFRSLLSEDRTKEVHFATIAYLAGLVARYCHPHADAGIRAKTLDELRELANDGVDEAQGVFELLTSPSTKITNKHELKKQQDFVDSPLTGIRLQLVEDSYEVEINGLVKHTPDESHSHYPINRLVRETRLRNEPVKIVIAGDLKHIHSVFTLFTLLKHKVDTLGIPNVRVDTGITDTTHYVNPDRACARWLKHWFHRSRQNIPSLGHLIQSASNNDIGEFRIKRDNRDLVPTSEELVLFYLRMLSSKWNTAFVDILASVGKSGKRAKRDYLTFAEKMMGLIPKGWRSAIDAHSNFSEFMRLEHPEYRAALNMLQPINLLTDNRIAQATLIVMTSQNGKTRLLQRYPAGVARKIVFLGEMSGEQGTLSRTKLESTYTPATFFSSAKWNTSKVKVIEKQLLKYLVPSLNQEVSTEKIKAVRLVEQKYASREAIESVREYVTQMQRLAARGQDKSLVDVLTFLSAVMQASDPCADNWFEFVDRCGRDREALNNAVFGNKTRTLSDAAAIKFLTHYVGPMKCVDRAFPGIYQNYNDELLARLVRRMRNRRHSAARLSNL